MAAGTASPCQTCTWNLTAIEKEYVEKVDWCMCDQVVCPAACRPTRAAHGTARHATWPAQCCARHQACLADSPAAAAAAGPDVAACAPCPFWEWLPTGSTPTTTSAIHPTAAYSGTCLPSLYLHAWHEGSLRPTPDTAPAQPLPMENGKLWGGVQIFHPTPTPTMGFPSR